MTWRNVDPEGQAELAWVLLHRILVNDLVISRLGFGKYIETAGSKSTTIPPLSNTTSAAMYLNTSTNWTR